MCRGLLLSKNCILATNCTAACLSPYCSCPKVCFKYSSMLQSCLQLFKADTVVFSLLQVCLRSAEKGRHTNTRFSEKLMNNLQAGFLQMARFIQSANAIVSWPVCRPAKHVLTQKELPLWIVLVEQPMAKYQGSDQNECI